VRPTAFFKSLAGQIALVQQGKPYVMFGDGQLASCKPISEQDLARFMADCVTGVTRGVCVGPAQRPGLVGVEPLLRLVCWGALDPAHPPPLLLRPWCVGLVNATVCSRNHTHTHTHTELDKVNAVLPVGGPGKALSAKEQADILFRCACGSSSRAPKRVARARVCVFTGVRPALAAGQHDAAPFTHATPHHAAPRHPMTTPHHTTPRHTKSTPRPRHAHAMRAMPRHIHIHSRQADRAAAQVLSRPDRAHGRRHRHL
jgi:hypothetical protein